jgi:hypothetical protein
MNPAPGWAADLHYADDEQVRLDLDVIIARGGRLRRKRRLIRLAAIAAVCATVPAAIFLGRSDPIPRLAPAVSGPLHAAQEHGIFGPNVLPGVSSPSYNGPAQGSAGRPFKDTYNLKSAPLEAGLQVAARVPARFGRLLAIAGARARSGVWLAAAASRLTLIHLSVDGALKSWRLPAGSGIVRAGTDIGFAVSAGVAWLGLGSTLIRVDTKARPALVSSWHVPGPQASHTNTVMGTYLFENRLKMAAHATLGSAATVSQVPRPRYSLAVSSGGRVAVATLHSSSVQLFDPYVGTFSQVRLPAQADQSLAVGFARDGTLGIGYLGKSNRPAVMLVKRSGAEQTATVGQSSAISAYGRSALLVGTSKLDVVSARGKVRQLVLPARRPAPDRDTAPPAPLPDGRLGIVSDVGILTFSGAAASVADATDGSLFWRLPRPGCTSSRCRPGYRLLATDAAGNVWLVPSADQRVIELLSVR